MKSKFLRFFKPAAPHTHAPPDHAETHYRRGNVLKDQGALEDALAEYDRAIALKADHAHAYCNRAVVLGLLQRLAEALASYDHAIAIDPSDAIAHCNRAMLLMGLGDKDAALRGFSAAIARDPDSFPAQFGCAALLQEKKRWTAALAAYDKAVTMKPDDALAHYNRGNVLQELERWSAALHAYDQAIALHPEFSLAHANRGVVLQELNQWPAALHSFDRSIVLNSRDATTHGNRAVLLQKMGRLEEALAGYDQAVVLNPASAETWFNRGTVLKDLDDLGAALQSYERALLVRSDYADAHLNRASTLQSMGLLPEAIEGYRAALHIHPDFPEAHYNLAMACLTIGDFATGWREYEWRWHATGGPIYREKRTFATPLWLGEGEIAGTTLLLYGEQGLGDSLQFCRYVDRVAQLGPRVILEVPEPLVDLCAQLPGVAEVIPYGNPLPAFDRHCPLMSLPLVFGTTLESIPSRAGYLRGDPHKVADWQQRLGSKTKPRIGLTWSGKQAPGTNRKRHFALSSLLPHLPAGFDYVCLQTEVLEVDQRTLAESPEIRHFGNLLRDFSETAALCECMDLVISVDTSVAHLSCALGMRTWVLLARVADWRWLLDRDDSPWYASARLFRQNSPGEWQAVFEQVAARLRCEFAAT